MKQISKDITDTQFDAPELTVTGATMEQAQKWVQVMSAIPADMNPINDETGEFAELGDTGDIHYIGGGFFGDVAEREFDVDLGDTLVVPLVNAWVNQFEDGPKDLPEAAINFLGSFPLSNVYLRIDLDNDGSVDYELNVDVSEVDYDPEGVSFPEGNAAAPFFVEPKKGDEFIFRHPKESIYAGREEFPNNGDTPGAARAAVTGYIAEIENLPEGTHLLEFGGEFDFGSETVAIATSAEITVQDTDDDMADDTDANLLG